MPYVPRVAYEILELTANPALVLTPATTVYSGIVRIGHKTRVLMIRSGAPATDFGFYPPEIPPLTEGEGTPKIWVEAQVTWFIPAGGTGGRFPVGVEWIAASYTPDPRGGMDRWLLINGAAHANAGLRLAYRVTMQTH